MDGKSCLNTLLDTNMLNRKKHFAVTKFVRINLFQLEAELPKCDALFSFVFHNDLKTIEQYLKGLNKELLFVKDRDGWSLLHYAALVGAKETLAFLIAQGMQPDMSCEARAFGVSGWRAIHIAAEMGNTEMLCLLLRHGANPELYVERNASSNSASTSSSAHSPRFKEEPTTSISWNALHFSIYSHCLEAVNVLLEARAYPEARTLGYRCTPLMIAAIHENLPALNLLLQRGASTKATDEPACCTALHYAAMTGMPEAVQALLAAGSDVRALTSNEANIVGGGCLPHHLAASARVSRSCQVLNMLLEVAPDLVDSCATWFATSLSELRHVTALVLVFTNAVRDYKEKSQVLLNRGANINHIFQYGTIGGMNLVRYVVEVRSVDQQILDFLLSNGADINNIASDGMSALLRAASRNMSLMVHQLCRYSPNVDVADQAGYTALMWAVKWKNVAMVNAILALKPNLEIAITFADARNNNYYNCTPVQMAVGKGNLELTRTLLDHGANLHTTMDSMGPDQDECHVSCLHTAVVMDHCHIGKLLLERGISPDVATSSNLTPMHYAASWGHVQFARLLLDAGAKVDPVGEHLRATPLIYAARRNKHDIMQLLLQHGSNINQQDKQGYTPLHWSLTFDHYDSIECLLEERWPLDINLLSESVEHRGHVTPLVLALEYSNLPTVERLLRRGSEPNIRFEANGMTLTPIFLSAEFGAVDKMRCLLRYGARVNEQSSRGETALHFALRFKKDDAALLLIHNGARFDYCATIGNGEQQQPVHVAAQLGQPHLIQLMVEHGAAVNSVMVLKSVEQVTSLHLAALNDLTGTLKKLVELGANVNCQRSDTFTPLLTAVSKSNLQAVKILLESGAEVNTRCIVSRSKDATCLHIAAQVGSLAIVNLLLSYGADVTARMTTGDRTGIQPVHLAAESGHLAIILRFLDLGIPVSCAEDCGLTCLHYAANGGKLDMLRFLLGRGANVAAVATFDDNNRVNVLPLHMAAEKGHTSCARALLDFNSPIDNVMSRNKRGGITALYLAVTENHSDTVSALLEAGADASLQDGIGVSPLHIACQRGYREIFHLLLSSVGAKRLVQLATHNGVTPLHIVAEKGYLQLSLWLLRLGAQLEAMCSIEDAHTHQLNRDIRPLHQACGFGHTSLIELLLAAGADYTAGEEYEGRGGVTPIHAAAIRGQRAALKVLANRCGSSVLNQQDALGWTALHWAARECFYDTVEQLLTLGADPSIRCHEGKLASDIALTNDIIGLLKSTTQRLST